MVYIDGPEAHLHPNAQVLLGWLAASIALEKNLKVVFETHSSIIALSMQALLSKHAAAKAKKYSGKPAPQMSAENICAHWVSWDEKNQKTIVEKGVFSDDGEIDGWPADFNEIEMDLQRIFLTSGEFDEKDDASITRISRSVCSSGCNDSH